MTAVFTDFSPPQNLIEMGLDQYYDALANAF